MSEEEKQYLKPYDIADTSDLPLRRIWLFLPLWAPKISRLKITGKPRKQTRKTFQTESGGFL